VALSIGALEGSSVALPAGALPLGATVTLAEATPPEKFAADPLLIPASSGLSIAATTADGTALQAPLKPMTVMITMLDTPAQLHEGHDHLEPTADNLCVFVAAADGSFLVFRSAQLEQSGKSVKLDVEHFGVFQAVFCADRELEGFVEAGTKAEEPLKGDVGAFFAAVAGTHQWLAVDTQASGDATWTHAGQYELIITVGGGITIASDGDPVEVRFDPDQGDSFEQYEHEEYVVIKRDDFEILVQHQFATDETPARIFATWSTGAAPDLVLWRFDDVGPTGDEGPLGGHHYAVATHLAAVNQVNDKNAGSLPNEYPVGDAVEVSVSLGADASTTFGDFAYDPNGTTISAGETDGKATLSITWRDPDSSTTPRRELYLSFVDGVFVDGHYKRVGASDFEVIFHIFAAGE
jgi:hypothetical protein